MKREIPHGLSVYLDLVRLGAALVVVLSHLWSVVFPRFPLPWPGHSAVVVFFVLSGYVISHAARPELALRNYVIHRAARIYPIALAVALLVVLVSLLRPEATLRYAGSRGSDWLDIGVNIVFLGQSWTDISLPFNAPFWSLNYEVWYYILFGIWLYCRSRVALAIAALLAGPKILLLLPVWLLGVVLHRQMRTLDRRQASLIFLVSLGAGLAFIWFDTGIKLREAMRLLWPDAIAWAKGSNQFAGDFILGMVVACHFLAAGSLGMGILTKFERPIRYMSSFTLTMYVAHMPLAVLIWSVWEVHSAIPFFTLLFGGIFLLGMFTERRTKWYRSFLSGSSVKKKQSLVYDPESTPTVPQS